jgi:hypothetical protein
MMGMELRRPRRFTELFDNILRRNKGGRAAATAVAAVGKGKLEEKPKRRRRVRTFNRGWQNLRTLDDPGKTAHDNSFSSSSLVRALLSGSSIILFVLLFRVFRGRGSLLSAEKRKERK